MSNGAGFTASWANATNPATLAHSVPSISLSRTHTAVPLWMLRSSVRKRRARETKPVQLNFSVFLSLACRLKIASPTGYGSLVSLKECKKR